MQEQKEPAANAFAVIHRELWTSWASLLRSYSAAHGLNSGRQAVVETGADEIVLRVADHWIRFTHNRMEDSLGNSIPFSLDEDGRARLGDTTEEMDLAAEKLAREMMQA
ncbi:MAG: transcriptional regulator [Acidobacteriaceae bacterium]